MILNMNKALKDEYACNPFIASTWDNEHTSRNRLPRTIEGNNPLAAIKYLQDFISNLFDFELGKYARLGIEGYSLLNEEIDKENPELITRFDMGDCNDGVLIVDFTTNKYCFVNVGGDSTVEKLKRYVPVDSSTYLKAYYPENEQDCSENELQSVIDDKEPIKFKQNTTINKKFIKRFKGFKTLSADELIKIFPANEGEISKASKKSVVKSTEIVTPV
jgi:hypothetical protein